MTLLNVSTKRPIFIMEIGAFRLSDNTIVTQYFSNTGYVTEPSDTPANTAYSTRLESNLTVSRSIFNNLDKGGIANTNVGNVTLANPDGGLDYLQNDYSLSGRTIVLKSGSVGDAHSTLSTIISGIIKNVSYSDSAVTITIEDNNSILEGQVDSTKYTTVSGEGELTFNTSLHDKPVPVCYGDVRNITPKLVGALNGGDTYTATLDPYYSGNIAFTEDKLTATNNNDGSFESTYSTIGVGSGKYYMEFYCSFISDGYIGVSSSVSRPRSDYIGSSASSWGFRASDGKMYTGGSGSAYGAEYVGSATVGVAIDGGTGSVWFSRNGHWYGSPSTGVGAAISGITGDIFVGLSTSSISESTTANFSLVGLEYSPPTGFSSGVVQPVAVSELVYQIHDGPITDITAVYSGGNKLDPDQYIKLLSEGKFQLLIGSTSGTAITADVKGSTSPTVYNSLEYIVKDILANRVEDTVTLDEAKFTTLATSYFAGLSIIDSAAIGLYIPEGATVQRLLEELNRSFGSYMGFTRDGTFDIGVFKGAEALSSIETLTKEYVTSISRYPTVTPKYEVSVGYARNYTVLRDSSVVATVTEEQPDHHAFLADKYRTALADVSELGIRQSDSVVEHIPTGSENLYWDLLFRYPNAKVANLIPSVVYDGGYAYLEAKRRWRLYNSADSLTHPLRLDVRCKIRPGVIQVNDTIHLVYPRFGLESGRYFTVLGFKEVLGTNDSYLDLWSGTESSFNEGTELNGTNIVATYIQYEGV